MRPILCVVERVRQYALVPVTVGLTMGVGACEHYFAVKWFTGEAGKVQYAD